MKRTVLINLICSFITVLVIALGIVLAILFNNSTIFTKPKLTISSESSTVIYDGKPLTNGTWHLASGELKNGHKLSVEVSGVQTDVGISENYVFAKVLDKNGNDVTNKYNIEYRPGALNVKARDITIVAGSDLKAYDGSPLTNGEYSIAQAVSLISGHTVTVTVDGTITDIGEANNKVTSVVIKSASGADVSRNYNIKTQDGKLVVCDPSDLENGGSNDPLDPNDPNAPSDPELPGDATDPENPELPDDSKDPEIPDDPNDPEKPGDSTEPMPDDTVVFTVLANHTGRLYLKMQSYGNYEPNNKGFAVATAYGNTMADGESAYYMVPYALENSGLSTYSAVISPKMGIYAIPYYTISGAATQTSDVVVEGNAQYSYTAHYYYWSGISGVVLPSKYKTYESEYAQFVKDNYLDIDDDTLAFMNTIIAEKKFLATDREIISKVAKYIQTAATYNLEYDVELDEESNFVTAFLSKYKEGVCRHYAAAATMLYRALGIPARYTEGFVAETKSGTVVDVTAAQAHAWVEVYINGIGWVNVEVTGSSSNQTQTKTKLTISPVDTRALYQEGVTLSASNTVTGFTISKDGYTYVATISGSVQGLGMVMSEIVDFEIYTSSGELVYKKSEKLGEDKFEIIYTKGIVQQYLSKLTFTSNSKEELYNGNSVDTALEDCSLVSGDLFSELGYTCVITPTGSVTLAGSAASTFSVTIYKNGVDCTSHFWVNKTYGTLTLTARELTVYAGSDEKPFDGTVLTCDSIIYDELQLAEGDYIADYVIEGSQKNIGSSSNVLKSVKILNQNGQNVTSNYTITIRDGLLTVTVPA